MLVLHDAGGDVVGAPAWDDLATDADVVQLRLPGYDGSDRPPAGWRPEDAGLAIAAAADRLFDAPPVVAGTSLGGWLAVEAELAAPGVASGLLLCSPAGLHVPQGYLFALFLDGRAAEGAERLLEQVVRTQVVREGRDAGSDAPQLAAAVTAPWLQSIAAAAACSWNPYVVDPGFERRLVQVGCPTTVLWGADDALIPVHHGRAYAAAIRGARLRIVRHAGHLLALERPDVVADEVRRLLPAAR